MSGCVAQRLGGAQQRVEIVDASHVAGVTDDELVVEHPLGPQRIHAGRERAQSRAVGPVGNHLELGRRDAEHRDAAAHSFAEDDVDRGLAQRAVAQRAQQPSRRAPRHRDAELGRHFREEILQPVDEDRAAQPRDPRDGDRDERRIGLGDDDVAPLEQPKQRHRGGDVEGQEIGDAAGNPLAAEGRRPYAMHGDAVDQAARREARRVVVVLEPARDDVNFLVLGQRRGKPVSICAVAE